MKTFKCDDCKDTKIYQGLGAPEPCRTCSADVCERPISKSGMGFRMPRDQELMRIIERAVRTGQSLDDLMRQNPGRHIRVH